MLWVKEKILDTDYDIKNLIIREKQQIYKIYNNKAEERCQKTNKQCTVRV